MSNLHEQPVVIQGKLPTPMQGVFTAPADSTRPSGTGVVIVNGGAQYRAGAHRLFVQLARHLARQGHTVLRFDFPGQGDSPGEPVAFEDTASHIAAAIDCLHQQQPEITQMALAGLCDGASASLLYLDHRDDTRVTHLVLLNPWVHNPITQARAQVKHYYRRRLLMPEFWRKLVGGRIGLSALRELRSRWWLSRQPIGLATPELSFQERMASAWDRFPGSVLLVLSEHDLVAQEFIEHAENAPAWKGWQQRARLHVLRQSSSDHTFSPREAQSELLQHVSLVLAQK